MKISIGVMAHNEEKNISSLLAMLTPLSDDVIVVSSSTDMTNEIVRKNPLVKLIEQKKRIGKALSINQFLAAAENDIIVLCSADVMPKKNSIPKLVKHLENKDVGIAASRPVPVKEKSLINEIVRLQWRLHHELSKKQAKFGELIAFRRCFDSISNTAVDEEEIARLIKQRGYSCIYDDQAIVSNIGPKSIAEFISQRRRIYCGHMELKKKHDYHASSVDNIKVAKTALQIIRYSDIHIFLMAAALEMYSRLLGTLDYYTKKRHYIWKMSPSTKNDIDNTADIQ